MHTARILITPHDLELDVLDESAYTNLAVASENVTAARRYDTEYQTELHWWPAIPAIRRASRVRL